MAEHVHPLRQYRRKHGLSCDELGKRLGRAGPTIRSYENGTRPMDAEFAVMVEKKLGIPRAKVLWPAEAA